MEGERNSINTGALGLYYISWFRGIKQASSPPHVCLHLFQFTCCRLPLPLGPDISFQPLPLVDVHPPFSSPYSPISSPHPSPPPPPSLDTTRLVSRLDSSRQQCHVTALGAYLKRTTSVGREVSRTVWPIISLPSRV